MGAVIVGYTYTIVMLDIKFIRENLDLVKAGAAKKHITIDLGRLLNVDERAPGSA